MSGEFRGPSPEEMGTKKETKENRIKLSKDEVILCRNADTAYPSAELHELLNEKGISFDQGMIKIEVDGENFLMNTSKTDFGTISYPDDDMRKANEL